MTRALRVVSKRLGYGQVGAHDCRHSCASMLRLRGFTSERIALHLRHASVRTTEAVYGGWAEEDRAKRPGLARDARPAQDRHRHKPPSNLGLLRGVPLLALLPEPTLAALARAAMHIEADVGDVIIRDGDHGDRFYVVESGSVEVTKDGRHVMSRGPGGFVGKIALLRDVPRTATVTATSATVLQALDRAHFVPAVTGQGEFLEAADAVIATRLAML